MLIESSKYQDFLFLYKYSSLSSYWWIKNFYSTTIENNSKDFRHWGHSFLQWVAYDNHLFVLHIDNSLGDSLKKIKCYRFGVDPTIRHSWLSTIMGGILNSLFLKGINQAQVQRYMTMKDYKTVTISALLSWPLITALSMTICFTGLIVFAKYHDCDPIRWVDNILQVGISKL